MNSEERQSEMEILSQNPYFSVVKKRLKLYDGSTSQYYIIDFPRPAVGVLATRGTRRTPHTTVPANCG